VRRRGFLKYDGKRTPITDNTKIEEVLGEDGILCIEDLIEEIWGRGPAFDKARRALWPFQVAGDEETVKGEVKKDGQQLKKNEVKARQGGLIGNVEEKINDLVAALI